MSKWWQFGISEPAPQQSRDVLVAAALSVKASRERIVPTYDAWQSELWGFYDELGEFRFAVTWKAEMVSRVRLRAAKLVVGRDEPELIDTGLPAKLVAELGGNIGGQSEILESLTTQLDVPGEGYLVGESRNGVNTWEVRSIDELRSHNNVYEVIDNVRSLNNQIKWRRLTNDSLVVRIWRPHKRWHHVADSPARAARSTMRELELVNRKIQAQYLSRLASAGVFVMPDEVSFPVREEFQEAADPFVKEWIETARESIKEPGAASSVIPMPMRVPAEYVDKFQHIDFTLKMDDKIIEKRESAIKRLATQVDVPAEILLGLGDLNHWSAWALEESAIKAHIVPIVEIIVNALTIGYLHPRLEAEGFDPTDYVVWYDVSELAIRPDRSDNAQKAYDRLELSPEAYRREIGFDESDAPTLEEQRQVGLRVLAKNPRVGFTALEELTGTPLDEPEPNTSDAIGSDRPSGNPEHQDDDNVGKPPDTKEDESDRAERVAAQAKGIHRVEFGLSKWTLHHPAICQESLFTCPVAEASRRLSYHPGTSGVYECYLSPTGEFRLGIQNTESLDGFLRGHTRRMTKRRLVDAKQ